MSGASALEMGRSGILVSGASEGADLRQALSVVISVALVGAGILVALFAQIQLHAVRRDDEAYFAIVPVVHAYLLLLTGVAVAHRPAWAPAIVAFIVAYFVTMVSRPVREQI